MLLGFLLVLFVSLLAIFLLLNKDISDKKLGPSPFKVDEAIAEENNAEYLKLLEIGKKIIGEEEYNDKYQPIDFNNPQPAIVLLQEYIQRNSFNLDEETMLLFKKFKLPKPSYVDKSISYDFINIMQYNYKKVLLEIFLNEFDNAKKDFINMKRVNEAVMNKSTNCALGLRLISFKLSEHYIVKAFVNNSNFTIDQKIEILEIQNNPIPSEFLINIIHFEEELFRSNILSLKKEHIKSLPYLIFQSYSLQPNNSVKFLRDTMIEKIIMYESPMSTYKDMEDNDKTPFVNLKFYSKNVQGKIILSIVIPILVLIPQKMQKQKNICNLFLVAKEILYFKKKTGAFPKTIEELHLPKSTTIDKFTNEQFLYSAENGILQCVFGVKNDCINLTSTKLTDEEIRKSLNEESKDDYILYLK